MSINQINSTNHADFIPEIWLQESLGYLRNKLVMARNVTKDSDLTGAFTVGDILNIPTRGTLTATSLTESGDITLQQPSGSKVYVTLNQHYHVAFSLSDLVKATSNQTEAMIRGYIEDGMAKLAEKVETDLLALYGSMSYTAGTAGVDIDESVILAARQKMNENNAPMNGRILVVSSKDETNVLKIDRLTRADAIGNGQRIVEGAIGRCHGFDVVQSNLVAVVAGTPTYHNLAFTKEGLVLASRALPPIQGAVSGQIQDPESGLIFRLTRGYASGQNQDQIVIDCLYGVAIMRQACLVDVQS